MAFNQLVAGPKLDEKGGGWCQIDNLSYKDVNNYEMDNNLIGMNVKASLFFVTRHNLTQLWWEVGNGCLNHCLEASAITWLGCSDK